MTSIVLGVRKGDSSLRWNRNFETYIKCCRAFNDFLSFEMPGKGPEKIILSKRNLDWHGLAAAWFFKLVGNLVRFQRRLESDYISLTICHSRESGNLRLLHSQFVGKNWNLHVPFFWFVIR